MTSFFQAVFRLPSLRFHNLSSLIRIAKDNPVHWTVEDEVVLIDFLLLHAAAGGDGGNFKMVTFNAAAPVIDAKRAKGGPKTAKACQNKYNSVYPTVFLCLTVLK